MKRNPFSPATKPVKPSKPMTFEQALKLLRAGKQVRRRSWHADSKLVRIDNNIFIRLPGTDPAPDVSMLKGALSYARPPQRWQPYPSDFLATDWVRA